MELIVAEKNNAARRISEVLSRGDFSTTKVNGVPVYEWDDRRCIGLAGHVVEVDFTEEYNDWHSTDPSDLIDADVTKKPSKKDIVGAVEKTARESRRAIIATDYDSEGELIGKEAYEIIKDVSDIPVRRVRFSSLTPGEIRDAFSNPGEIDDDLAAAGEARQIIDLIWGAALTRYISLASNRLGNAFLSVGRVQSPTLKILVDKEKEIEEFDPDPYWEIYADVDPSDEGDEEVESQYFYKEDGKEQERIWDSDAADEVYSKVSDAEEAVVDSVNTRTRNDYPPTPFDTTQFIRAAGAIGFSASNAMSIAEDLYTNGFISYPRTDNTVYPDEVEIDGVLEVLANHDDFSDDAKELLASDPTPTSGDKETTDHPPIYPTSLASRDELNDAEWRIYELVVRRFFATLADAAKWEHVKAVFDIDGESFKANGKRLIEEGYHAYYPYFSTEETSLPDLEAGDTVSVVDSEIEEKETQPPKRYGQSRLVEKMEEMGVGTKCLTGDTRIAVSDGDDVHRVRADEVFDEENTVMTDGDTDAEISVSDSLGSVVSFDHIESRIRNRDATVVSRRELEDDEEVLRIRTTNSEFSVTEDHPVYVFDDGINIRRADEINEGDELVSARLSVSYGYDDDGDAPALGWEEFTESCDKSTKLYGTGCNEGITEIREETGESQSVFAERLGTYHDAISRFETDKRDVPLWLAGDLDLVPEEIHGLNPEEKFENPFPIDWSPAVARLIGSVLGDGSVRYDESENTVDIRYHNTDEALIQRFVRDIEYIFGTEPSVHEREYDDKKDVYYVQLPSAVSRIVVEVLGEFEEKGAEYIPEKLQPVFVGALFDDEGHVSTDGKAFISNIDHSLLSEAGKMLSNYGIDSSLNEPQHKLYIRGRRDLELFLDTVPVLSDKKFYRGIEHLTDYGVTRRKARLLELIDGESLTSDEISDVLGVSRSVVNSYLRELKQDGYVETEIEGSNRSHDSNRSFLYSSKGYRNSVYSLVLGYPSTSEVVSVERRDYDGYVYDLTVDETAPNFAVEGGAVVHNSTRHNTIQKLYDRGYIEEDPPRPTGLARAVIEAMEEYADVVTDPEMTRRLEKDMERIAEGEISEEEVMEESREMLERIFEILEEKEEEIGESLREGLKEDRTLGDCPECGGDLVIRRTRGGSQFIGCDAYPDCENTYPLPNKGDPVLVDDKCDEHGLQKVKMLAGRSTHIHGCPICKEEEAEDDEETVIGDCPECGDDEGGELAVKRTRSGGRLVGCTRYPDCDYSLPLPRRGDLEITDEICDEHDLPEMVIHSGSEPWELGCPICNYENYKKQQEKDKGLQAIKGIGDATEEKLNDAGIEEVDDLKEADPEDLAEKVDGVSADRIQKWQSA
ncbi:DNA topoisomerase I [Halorutilales archaeon Cl-col2-1]